MDYETFFRIERVFLLLLPAMLFYVVYANITLIHDYNVLVEKYNNLSERHSNLSQSYLALYKNYDFLWNITEQLKTAEKTVVVPNTITVGFYNLSFINSCFFDKEGVILQNKTNETQETQSCLGYTSEDRNIWLVDNRSIGDIIETCNHEIAHNVLLLTNSSYEEHLIEELDEHMMFPECEALRNSLNDSSV